MPLTNQIISNTAIWSPDSQWIVFDTRSDPAGAVFDSKSIQLLHHKTREIKTLYKAPGHSNCGVATHHPTQAKIVFIQGPPDPTQYAQHNRQGLIVDYAGNTTPLDARNLTPPFTPGALRGGTHLHVFNPANDQVLSTYNDALLDSQIRDIALSLPNHPVTVPATHPSNHAGQYFTAVLTQTTPNPTPGSDQITRASEEAWLTPITIAFQGQVKTTTGQLISEVFLLTLPPDPTQPDASPLQGTKTTRPAPPKSTTQIRLTHTQDRKHPGLQSPRHWLRANASATQIAFLMKDDNNITQLHTINPITRQIQQVTHNPFPVNSAFSWHPTENILAYIADNSVFTTHTDTHQTKRQTPKPHTNAHLRPEACVFSPDGQKIAYVIHQPPLNQIQTIPFEPTT